MEKSRDFYQIITIFIACLIAFCDGLFYAWPSATIPLLIEDPVLNITLDDCSYFAIIPMISTVITSPLYAILMNRIGRKISLLCIALPQLISWIIVATANHLYLFYLSRIFSGFGDAGVLMVLQSYIGEIATPQVRGSWGNLSAISNYFGYFSINLISTFLSVKETAYIMAAIPVIFLLLFTFLPESPYYLLMKDNVEEAMKSLRKLRMKEDVDVELQQLEADFKRQTSESSGFKDIFLIDSNRRALFVTGFLQIAQQFSGFTCFIVYNQYMFQKAGSDLPYTTSSNIYMGLLFLCVVFASFTMNKFGRRTVMIISCAGCCLLLTSLTIYFYLDDYTTVDVSSANWFPLLGMVLYTIVYALGLGIVPRLILSEIFSANLKGASLTVMNLCFAATAAGSSKIFEVLVLRFGLTGPMGLLAVCCLLSSVVSYLIMPETKGKTLEEIQQALKGKSKSEMVKNTSVRV